MYQIICNCDNKGKKNSNNIYPMKINGDDEENRYINHYTCEQQYC